MPIPDIPSWITEPLQSGCLPMLFHPPVTSEIGTPIVNIPGCVEAHKDNQRIKKIKDEDPESVMTYYAGTPSFNAIDYDTNKVDYNSMKIYPPPAYKAPEPKTPPQPKTPAVPKTPGTILVSY